MSYGYRVVRGPMDRRGEPERGLREIDPAQAQVVRRVFERFAAGGSPIAIAKVLSAEGIPGPRGGPETHWQHRRAVSLLSGKVICGACGGSYATNGKDYMGCKAAERRGTCTNKVRIRRSRVEAEVLEAARALIARVEVHPPTGPDGRPRLELLGELSALLAAAGVEGVGGNAESPPTFAGGLDTFSGSVLGDAGTGFGLWRTLLGLSPRAATCLEP